MGLREAEGGETILMLEGLGRHCLYNQNQKTVEKFIPQLQPITSHKKCKRQKKPSLKNWDKNIITKT